MESLKRETRGVPCFSPVSTLRFRVGDGIHYGSSSTFTGVLVSSPTEGPLQGFEGTTET